MCAEVAQWRHQNELLQRRQQCNCSLTGSMQRQLCRTHISAHTSLRHISIQLSKLHAALPGMRVCIDGPAAATGSRRRNASLQRNTAVDWSLGGLHGRRAPWGALRPRQLLPMGYRPWLQVRQGSPYSAPVLGQIIF